MGIIRINQVFFFHIGLAAGAASALPEHSQSASKGVACLTETALHALWLAEVHSLSALGRHRFLTDMY